MHNWNIKHYLYKLAAIVPTGLFSLGSFSACPFSMPFYAGVFGYLGLKEWQYEYYFFIVLVSLMLVSLIYALYLSIRSRQYLLMVTVVCGFCATIFSKFNDMKILLYLGFTIFVISIFQIKKTYKSCTVSESKKTKNKTN